jgi:hypothetical protein
MMYVLKVFFLDELGNISVVLASYDNTLQDNVKTI